MPETAAYVYCVVKAGRKPSTTRIPRGLPGATSPRAVDAGRGLWCVMSEVPLDTYGSKPLETALADMAWVADVALAHEAVVEHFARLRGATAVPMKLFTMFSSAARALADVQARRREVEAVVKRIAGCEEWGVRVTRAVPATARPGREGRPASGAAFLAARKRARDEARETAMAALESAEVAFDRLAALAAASSRRDDVPQGATAPPLLDAAFLVRADRRARFKSAAKRAAGLCAAAGAMMTLTGPWPAYNFVQPRRASG